MSELELGFGTVPSEKQDNNPNTRSSPRLWEIPRFRIDSLGVNTNTIPLVPYDAPFMIGVVGRKIILFRGIGFHKAGFSMVRQSSSFLVNMGEQ